MTPASVPCVTDATYRHCALCAGRRRRVCWPRVRRSRQRVVVQFVCGTQFRQHLRDDSSPPHAALTLTASRKHELFHAREHEREDDVTTTTTTTTSATVSRPGTRGDSSTAANTADPSAAAGTSVRVTSAVTVTITGCDRATAQRRRRAAACVCDVAAVAVGAADVRCVDASRLAQRDERGLEVRRRLVRVFVGHDEPDLRMVSQSNSQEGASAEHEKTSDTGLCMPSRLAIRAVAETPKQCTGERTCSTAGADVYDVTGARYH